MDGLGQGLARDLTPIAATTAPPTTIPTPMIVHRRSSTMKLEPRMRPSPCPIQTSPTRMRIPAMIVRARIDTSKGGILARWTR